MWPGSKLRPQDNVRPSAADMRAENCSCHLLYRRGCRPYVPRPFNRPRGPSKQFEMRQETETLVDEIKQAIGLLRRHL